jgi:sec-independent protein translocase protein TatA
MGELAPDKILLIVVVALLLFGAKRLPEVGASLGRGIREFKRSISDTQDPGPGSEESRPAAPGQLQHGTPSPPPPTSGQPKRLSD